MQVSTLTYQNDTYLLGSLSVGGEEREGERPAPPRGLPGGRGVRLVAAQAQPLPPSGEVIGNYGKGKKSRDQRRFYGEVNFFFIQDSEFV